MMVDLRDRLIGNRTQLSNAIRGYAAEFGFTAAKGMAHIDPLLDRIQADESVPVLVSQSCSRPTLKNMRSLQTQVAEIDAKLMAWHKADECSRRLADILGIGPIGATLLLMKTPAPQMFRSGRQFAAWIGMTPKDQRFNGRQGQAWCHHKGRRRSLAQRVSGWGDRRHPNMYDAASAGQSPGSSTSSSA